MKINLPTPRDNKDMTEQLEKHLHAINDSLTRKGHYQMVREFHEAMGQPVGDKPAFLDMPRFEFRKRLIDEEYDEFLDAISEGDLANAFKELADMIYVINGMAVEMGGDLDAVFSEVHRSNMTKLPKDGIVRYRDDGKVLKPVTYEAADVQGVLF